MANPYGSVYLHFTDGTVQKFESMRGGGSFANRVRYEGAFVVVRDVYDNETAFPAANVQRVEVR